MTDQLRFTDKSSEPYKIQQVTSSGPITLKRGGEPQAITVAVLPALPCKPVLLESACIVNGMRLPAGDRIHDTETVGYVSVRIESINPLVIQLFAKREVPSFSRLPVEIKIFERDDKSRFVLFSIDVKVF
ncbi:hypothetical protein EDP1_2891 [Pseudomonas putida S610]|uniref:hypothetical protein n=1 Tax=Pseudomonas putida group TaxID=136845 RepID=UPI0003C5BF56|nr:hypothetical protein [Pseudomonas putida]EST13812.1 hypothetical protein EDP1_2891 [Pseudomonas putida S610]